MNALLLDGPGDKGAVCEVSPGENRWDWPARAWEGEPSGPSVVLSPRLSCADEDRVYVGGVGMGHPVGLGVRLGPGRSGSTGGVWKVGEGPEDDGGRLGIVDRSGLDAS